MTSDNYNYSDDEVLAALKQEKPKSSMSPIDMAKDFGMGILETPLSMASATGRSIYGGLKGYSTLFDNYKNRTEQEKVNTASNAINSVMSGAYQPQSNTGKAIQKGLAWPFEKAGEFVGEVGGRIGENINGQQGRIAGEAIGKASIPVGMTLLSGNQMLGSANKIPKIQNELKIKNKDPYFSLQKDIKKAGNDIGLIAPAESGLKRTLSNVGGADNALSMKNSQVATGKLAEQVGMKAGAISDTDLMNRIGELTQSYTNVQKTLPVEIKVGLPFKKSVNDILLPMKERIAQDPEAFSGYQGAINLLEQQLKQDTISPAILMDKIKKLRSDARQYNKNIAGEPIKIDLADASFKLANIYEDLVESQLGDKTALLGKFRDSRKQLSQIHIIDQARKADGLIDLQKLSGVTGKYGADRKMVTGNLKTITDFTNTFKTVTKPIEQAGLSTPSRWELYAAGGGIAAAPATSGMSLIAALPSISRAVVPTLAEKGMLQGGNPSYMLQALGKSAPSMAKGASALGTVGSNINYLNKDKYYIDNAEYSDDEIMQMMNGQ